MQSLIPLKTPLLLALSLSSATLPAQQVTSCVSPEGHAYFAQMGVVEKQDSGWKTDMVSKGAFTLRKLGKEDFDIIYIDSSNRKYSTTQDGAKVFPLRRSETEAAFLAHYHEFEESQIYSFFKDNNGEFKFSLLVSKGGPSVYKSSVMVGNCSRIDFKLLNDDG